MNCREFISSSLAAGAALSTPRLVEAQQLSSREKNALLKNVREELLAGEYNPGS